MYFYLPKLFYPFDIVNFLLTVCVCFFVTGAGLAGVCIYIISHALLTLKTTFNKCMYELACQCNYV